MIIKVDTGSLSGTIQTLESEVNQVEQVQTQLKSSILALGTMWEGSAHDTFEEQFLQDDAFVTELIQELRTLIDDLRSAQKNYDACDVSVRSLIQALAI